MVNDNKLFDIAAGRSAFSLGPRGQFDDFQDLPDVPVLAETLLLMELRSRESSVDLREISQLVLGDLGASLQIMRLAGREYGSALERPARIEDCISAMGLHACLEAISRLILTRRGHQTTAIQIWLHSKSIAELSAFLAEEMFSNVSAEEAYLVGLFHELGSLPAILGWEWPERGPRIQERATLRMAEAWCLPQCVLEYLDELDTPGSTYGWIGIVHRAHRMTSSSSSGYPLDDHMLLRLSLAGRPHPSS